MYIYRERERATEMYTYIYICIHMRVCICMSFPLRRGSMIRNFINKKLDSRIRKYLRNLTLVSACITMYSYIAISYCY